MKKAKKWFTFVEVIVATTILILLSSLGLYSFSKYSSNTRDIQRVSDMKNIVSSMNLYKQKRWSLPLPWDYFTIKNGATINVAYQWKLNEKVSLPTLETIPLDPLLKIPYIFSVTKSRQDYQVATTLENKGYPIALLDGNYEIVSKNVLPSLIIAYDGSGSVDITTNAYKNKFILNSGNSTLPYSLDTWIATSDTTKTFNDLLQNPSTILVQNTSFKSCDEIADAWKWIGAGEYQILSSTGSLENTWCNFYTLWQTGSTLCSWTLINGAEWNNSWNYTQIWDGSIWTPIVPKSANYNTTTSAEDCRYICKTNYIWDGSSCNGATQKITNCSWALPANASWVDQLFTQTWDSSAWAPASLTCSQGISWEGTFKCDTWYYWYNNSSCQPNNS